MKKSNQLLLGLLALYLAGVAITDGLLVRAYAAINLKDPLRNYEDVAVRPFRALELRGGNHYSIQVRYGPQYRVQVLQSRKSFLETSARGDTLSINFTVARSRAARPGAQLPLGLIITCPDLSWLRASGTHNLLGPLQGDSLRLEQDAQTASIATGLRLRYLQLLGRQESLLHLKKDNVVDALAVQASDRAGVSLQGIRLGSLLPQLSGEAYLIYYQATLAQLQGGGGAAEGKKPHQPIP